MISVIIPSYRNPKCLDICLKSAIANQNDSNEIIVIIDGFVEESRHIMDEYKGKVKFLPLDDNHGMQHALNVGVFNASNEWVLIVNDDNVFPKEWDSILLNKRREKVVTSPDQIERQPSMFDFIVDDFGGVDDFRFEEFTEKEPSYRKPWVGKPGEIFPFFMQKKYYMAVGGFDEWYQSPFICDWDFFLKLELIGAAFIRTRELAFYHFGSMATKNGNEAERFKESESLAWSMFTYKWGFQPLRNADNSHGPNTTVRGINYGR